MEGKDIQKSVVTVLNVVILVLIFGLIAGTLLGLSIFSSLTIINTTEISTNVALFVSGLIAFFSIIGTVVGIVWLVSYIKKLFDKKEGLQSISA